MVEEVSAPEIPNIMKLEQVYRASYSRNVHCAAFTALVPTTSSAYAEPGFSRDTVFWQWGWYFYPQNVWPIIIGALNYIVSSILEEWEATFQGEPSGKPVRVWWSGASISPLLCPPPPGSAYNQWEAQVIVRRMPFPLSAWRVNSVRRWSPISSDFLRRLLKWAG